MNPILSNNKIEILLELLAQDKINRNQFYQMKDLEDREISNIKDILQLDELTEKDLLIEQLLDCKNLQLRSLYSILSEDKEFRTNIEKRNFMIQNIDKPYIKKWAPFIKYDFVFNDKELLKTILEKEYKEIFLVDTIIKTLLKQIKENPKSYENGSKNAYLKEGLRIKSCENLTRFIESIETIEKLEEPKWYHYLSRCCNEVKFDKYIEFELGVSFKKNIKTMYEHGKKEGLNQKLLELDQMETSGEEKLKMFANLIYNLRLIADEDSDNLDNDKYFDYLMRKSLISPGEFNCHETYIKIFTDDDSPCKEGSKLYQAISELSYIDGIEIICEAFETSLKNVITVDFIKEYQAMEEEKDSENKLEDMLEELAIKHNAMDYLEKYCFLENSEDSLNKYAEYINNHKDLTKEELLELRERLIEEKQKEILKIEQEKRVEQEDTISGKIKKMRRKLFSK